MRNGNNSRWPGRGNLFGKSVAPQAPVAFRTAKRPLNKWKAPVTAEYMQALREADELVFQAILRGAVVRHSARVVKS